MEKQDKPPFADGILFKRNPNAPEWIVGGLSIKVEEAIPFLQSKAKGGWVNLNIKQSQGGNYYVDLDTWEPTQGGGQQQASKPKTMAPPKAKAPNDDLPF